MRSINLKEGDMKNMKFFAAAMAATILFAAQSWAGATCHDVQVVKATISAVDPMMIIGNYAGTAELSLDGGPSTPASLFLTPVQVKTGEDGTVHLTGRMAFDFGAVGTLVAEDNAILSPTENPYVYRMNTRFEDFAGTGLFTGAFGRFVDHGEFSILTATLNAAGEGRICW